MGTIYGKPDSTGALSGSATAAQLPDVEVAGVVRLKAQQGNSGNVYIGLTNGVTKPTDQTDDGTTGYELDAGQEIELVVDNLNELWIICDNAGDDLTFLIKGT